MKFQVRRFEEKKKNNTQKVTMISDREMKVDKQVVFIKILKQ